MKDSDTVQFLSSIAGFVSPKGILDDPEGKDGLSRVVASAFEFGTKRNPGPRDLFYQIENIGAVFSSVSGWESSYIFCSAPRERFNEITPLLDEILHETELQERYLNNIKENQKAWIDEFRSEDHGYAIQRFKCLAMELRMPSGTHQTVDSITLDDVKEGIKRIVTDSYNFSLVDSEILYFPDPYPQRPSGSSKIDLEKSKSAGQLNEDSHSVDLGSNPSDSNSKNIKGHSDQKRRAELFENIDSDIEQKVVIFGYTTDGWASYDPTLTGLVGTLMSGGLYSVVSNKIREQNSAAYYAYFNHTILSDRGSAGIIAGISEENLTKVIGLMEDLIQEGEEGVWSDERIEEAKQYHIGRLGRAFESPVSITSISLNRLINGFPLPDYESEVEKVLSIKKDQIVDYFKQIKQRGQRVLLVNGNLKRSSLQVLERSGYVR